MARISIWSSTMRTVRAASAAGSYFWIIRDVLLEGICLHCNTPKSLCASVFAHDFHCNGSRLQILPLVARGPLHHHDAGVQLLHLFVGAAVVPADGGPQGHRLHHASRSAAVVAHQVSRPHVVGGLELHRSARE